MLKEAAKLVEMFQLMLVVCALFDMVHSMALYLVRTVLSILQTFSLVVNASIMQSVLKMLFFFFFFGSYRY